MTRSWEKSFRSCEDVRTQRNLLWCLAVGSWGAHNQPAHSTFLSLVPRAGWDLDLIFNSVVSLAHNSESVRPSNELGLGLKVFHRGFGCQGRS